MQRPGRLALFVILSVALLPIAVWLDLRHISNETLTSRATSLNAVISEIRQYYSSNVVGRIAAHDGKKYTDA